MESFALIMGHLIGDYIFQNDWMAKNKISSSFVCTIHCLIYTFICYCCCWWFLPYWTYLIVFVTHWPVDRFRLARKWMNIMGQKEFATGPFSPWSIIVVDNILHLFVLFEIGLYLKVY